MKFYLLILRVKNLSFQEALDEIDNLIKCSNKIDKKFILKDFELGKFI